MIHLGLNKNSFSKAIGLSNNVTIGRIINEDREPSFDILTKIIQTYGSINANWLLTGEGEMFLPPQSLKDAPPNAPPITPQLNTHSNIQLNTQSKKSFSLHKGGEKDYVCELCQDKQQIIDALKDANKAKQIAIDSLLKQIDSLTSTNKTSTKQDVAKKKKSA